MVAMVSERRSMFRDDMEEMFHDVFRWSTVIGVMALAGGMAAAGQAFRGNGFDELIFGPAAVVLLAVAAVVLPRALRTAESNFTVPYLGGSAFAAGVDGSTQMAWWLKVAVTLVACSGLAWLRSRLRQPATAGGPRESQEMPTQPGSGI